MLDISKVIFLPHQKVKDETDERGTVKKIVDKRFTLKDKESILRNKGITDKELPEQLKNFLPEMILPSEEMDLISKNDKSLVIESQHIALSYTSGKGPEDPHWHPDEVETYLIHDEIEVAIRYIDRPMKHEIYTFKPGRIIFPPRLCHFTDLRGYTEVISFREKELMQRVNCKTCYLSESKECEGLIKTDKGFEGDEKLIQIANKRIKWLNEK